MTAGEAGPGQGQKGERRKDGPALEVDDDRVLSVIPLLTFARELSALYVPVKMRPEFASELDASIRVAARERYAQDLLMAESADGQHRYRERMMVYLQPVSDRVDRRLVLGAALGSAVSVSIAGLVAYAWRQRGRRVA